MSILFGEAVESTSIDQGSCSPSVHSLPLPTHLIVTPPRRPRLRPSSSTSFLPSLSIHSRVHSPWKRSRSLRGGSSLDPAAVQSSTVAPVASRTVCLFTIIGSSGTAATILHATGGQGRSQPV